MANYGKDAAWKSIPQTIEFWEAEKHCNIETVYPYNYETFLCVVNKSACEQEGGVRACNYDFSLVKRNPHQYYI